MTTIPKVTDGVDDVLAAQYNLLVDGVQQLLGPSGFMTNGKFSVTVSGNNITVALKTLSGSDATVTDPIAINVHGTIRLVTAPLSVTKNAGTNWFNAGSTALATKEIDYFIYIGYNATDGVVIGFARIPDAGQYSDFSTTSTNDHYCAISTITNAAASDFYVVVGRFAATLSAAAGHNWSVPTFTPANLIHHPIFETRMLSWNPDPQGFSAVPTNTAYRYQLSGTRVYIAYCELTDGTSNAITFTVTPPITASGFANAIWGFTMQTTVNNGAILTTPGRGFILASAPTTITFRPDTANSNWTAANGKRAIATGWYEH